MDDFHIESINCAWNNVKVDAFERSENFSAGLGMSSFINRKARLSGQNLRQVQSYGLDLVQGELPILAHIIVLYLVSNVQYLSFSAAFNRFTVENFHHPLSCYNVLN